MPGSCSYMACIENIIGSVPVDPDGIPLGVEGVLNIDMIAYESFFNMARNRSRALETAAQLAAAIAQLVIYYELMVEAVDARDEHIQYQLDFMQELRDLRDGQDYPMLQLKSTVIEGLVVPEANVCGEAGNYLDESVGDGEAIDETAKNLARQSCAGVPHDWGIHGGALAGALAAPHGAGIMGNHSKRRQESFRTHKTDLVRAGQQGMKAVYRASDILGQYSQATAIYAGLADLYVQGFNSAGAALGVALGKLSQGLGTDSAPDSGGDNFSQSRPSSGPTHLQR